MADFLNGNNTIKNHNNLDEISSSDDEDDSGSGDYSDDSIDSNKDCIICYEELKLRSITNFRCNHNVHKDCFNEFCQNQLLKQCPKCRKCVN